MVQLGDIHMNRQLIHTQIFTHVFHLLNTHMETHFCVKKRSILE